VLRTSLTRFDIDVDIVHCGFVSLFPLSIYLFNTQLIANLANLINSKLIYLIV
jgi:hypothetical protein